MDQSQPFTQQDTPQAPIQDQIPPASMTPSQTRPAISPLGVVGIILVIIFVGAGGFLLGGRIRNVPQVGQKQTTDTNPSATNTPILAKSKQTLQEAIVQNCIVPNPLPSSGKMPISTLPFEMEAAFKKKYNLNETIWCGSALDNLNQGTISDLVRKDKYGNDITLFIFHDKSALGAWYNPYAPLETHSPITINQKTYFLQIVIGGPNGITEAGTGTWLWSGKFDPVTQTKIHIFADVRLPKEFWYKIGKKYGTKNPNYNSEESEPEFFVDERNIDQYQQELIQTAPTLPEFQQAAQEISSDLDGIQFQ